MYSVVYNIHATRDVRIKRARHANFKKFDVLEKK